MCVNLDPKIHCHKILEGILQRYLEYSQLAKRYSFFSPWKSSLYCTKGPLQNEEDPKICQSLWQWLWDFPVRNQCSMHAFLRLASIHGHSGNEVNFSLALYLVAVWGAKIMPLHKKKKTLDLWLITYNMYLILSVITNKLIIS